MAEREDMNTKSATPAACGVPSDREAALADRAGRTLDAMIEGTRPISVRCGARRVDIPTRAAGLLRQILDYMAHGKGVAVTPLHAELTTRQAAELLQVSRTHLVQLLDEGLIPCRKVGSHRRVRLEDILVHRRKTESRRREALDELTARDQELGLQ